MGLITKEGVLLPATATEAYVTPAGKITNFINLLFTNPVSGNRQAPGVWLVPSGGSADDTNKIIDHAGARLELRVNESVDYPWQQALGAGDKIFWAADDADVVAAALDVQEATAAGDVIDGLTRVWAFNDGTPTNTGYMPNTPQVAFTVPAGRQVVALHLVARNKSATRQPFALWAVPEGGSEANDYLIVSASGNRFDLRAGETRWWSFPRFLGAGDMLMWRAAAASSIVCRLSVEMVVL